MNFKKSKTKQRGTRRFKILLFGTHGVGKTTAALQSPNPAVIDMERGTEHYEELYDFVVERTSDPDKVLDIVTEIAENPIIPLGTKNNFSAKTIVLDPIHVWELSVEQKVIARRRREERNPDYVLQPQDYKSIKIEKKKLMLKLINIDLNVIVCARTKDIYAPGEFMKKIGIGPDCDSQWLGYFDTILFIYLDKITKKRMAIVYDKDRTNKLPKDTAGNYIAFEFSFNALAGYLKDFNFDAESDVNATHEMENQMLGRHFITKFRNKNVATAGINGETLEVIAKLMKEETISLRMNELLKTSEVESPYDLTQDMANFIISEIKKLPEVNK